MVPKLTVQILSLFKKSEVLNMNTAQGLSNCVFFYNCKLFAFRAKDEHRNLDSSQFSINHDHKTGLSFLEFHDRSCKKVQGGLKHKKWRPKISNTMNSKITSTVLSKSTKNI